jgi:hypothetical protein
MLRRATAARRHGCGLVGNYCLKAKEQPKSMLIGKVAAPRRETLAAFMTPCGDSGGHLDKR